MCSKNSLFLQYQSQSSAQTNTSELNTVTQPRHSKACCCTGLLFVLTPLNYKEPKTEIQNSLTENLSYIVIICQEQQELNILCYEGNLQVYKNSMKCTFYFGGFLKFFVKFKTALINISIWGQYCEAATTDYHHLTTVFLRCLFALFFGLTACTFTVLLCSFFLARKSQSEYLTQILNFR